MPVLKEHLEFFPVDMELGWSQPQGAPEGVMEKILCGRLDEAARTGSRTRLVRFGANVFTTAPVIHEYWEEVFVFKGDLIVGADATGKGGIVFGPGTYACRPPHIVHGPFGSEKGCILFEVHYFGATPDAGISR
ncbi:MAG TPA: cupin domain-containing protein [Pseudolabrys sp.]|nr:cupin domain-containing protein [Pseudolabrys sp.]